MKSERVNFLNKDGNTLAGKIEFPVSGKPRAYALFAHCFTCSKNLNAVTNISLALTQNNIAVLRFDFTGLGQSDGTFEDSNFSTNVQDIVDAYAFLESNYEAPKILIGHSLGGAAVLSSAGQMPAVQAIATIGAPAEPDHVKKLFQDGLVDIESSGAAEVSIGGRPFTIKKQFLDDLEQSDHLEKIRNLKKSLLIMHSPQDSTVHISNAAKIYDAAFHPKSFISLDGADHLLSAKEDSLYAGSMIASWATRYVDLNEEDSLTTDKQVAVRTSQEGYTTEIRAGVHSLIADEPKDVGGKDLGPSPYGYLNAALGACTSMTLRMYADHKKWDLKEVTVHLSHEKDYLKDSQNPEDSKRKIDIIEREIELVGDLDEQQRQRLLEIADRCPVHKTLHGPIKVNTALKA